MNMDRRIARSQRCTPATNLFIGFVLVALGVLFTLDNLQIWQAREILRYWPAALIAVGIGQIAGARAPGGWLGGAIWVAIGSVLLGNRLGYFSISIWNFWPLLLVLIGLRIVLQAYFAGSPGGSNAAAGSTLSAVSILGGFDRKIMSQELKLIEVTSFLGGGKLDLRDAKPADGQAVINVVALMGGLQVLVPSNWNVVLEATPFMGGVDDRRRQPATMDPAAPRLVVRGFVMMGGVEIKD